MEQAFNKPYIQVPEPEDPVPRKHQVRKNQQSTIGLCPTYLTQPT